MKAEGSRTKIKSDEACKIYSNILKNIRIDFASPVPVVYFLSPHHYRPPYDSR